MHANTIPSTHKNEDNATELEGGLFEETLLQVLEDRRVQGSEQIKTWRLSRYGKNQI